MVFQQLSLFLCYFTFLNCEYDKVEIEEATGDIQLNIRNDIHLRGGILWRRTWRN